MSLRIIPSLDGVRQALDSKGYKLLKHQEKAVKWMYTREMPTNKNRGGILADEMGVGKTIETIGLMIMRPVRYTLVIVPASLISQWGKELEKFTQGITISKHTLPDKPTNQNIVITSFMKSTYDNLSGFKWDRVIIDEAHIIRNPKGKIFKKICSIKSDTKWCLTGTPIQNYISDIKTLLQFVGVKKNSDLKQSIKKYLFRRTKEEVNIKLGGYEEKKHLLDFQSLYEKDMYRKVADNCYESINVSILEILLRMRQAAILPQLIVDGYNKKKKKTSKWKYSNTKIKAIVETLEKNPEEKPVIFCYFKREMEFLETKLEDKGIEYRTINGSVSMEDRQEIITSSDDFRVLIVQIMAGSTGLNLQKFNSVYFSGPHWNPTHEQQAIARVYRLGQDKKVTVRKFILRNTIEEMILDIQNRKIEMINEHL